MGDHPSLFFYREEDDGGGDNSGKYDVGVCVEHSPTLILNSEKDNGSGEDDMLVVAKLHQYGLAYYRHLQFDQDKCTAFNAKRDALWDFLET